MLYFRIYSVTEYLFLRVFCEKIESRLLFSVHGGTQDGVTPCTDRQLFGSIEPSKMKRKRSACLSVCLRRTKPLPPRLAPW